MKKLVASYSIVTVISVLITFHEPSNCDLIKQSKSQDSVTFNNDNKTDKPHKNTQPRVLSYSVPLLRILSEIFLLHFFFLLFFFPPPPNLSFADAFSASALQLPFIQRRTL